MKKPMSAEQATIRLEELCARSEQCTQEVREKLRKWGIGQHDSDVIVRHLTERHFIDDLRYATAYVRDKYRFSKWGRRKIYQGLAQKRIARDLADEAMDEIDLREYANIAFNSIRLKLRSLPDTLTIQEKREKLLRFGIGRGYETSLLLKILNSEKLWES